MFYFLIIVVKCGQRCGSVITLNLLSAVRSSRGNRDSDNGGIPRCRRAKAIVTIVSMVSRNRLMHICLSLRKCESCTIFGGLPGEREVAHEDSDGDDINRDSYQTQITGVSSFV